MEKLREHDRENIPPGSVVSAPPITNPVTGAASSPATSSGKFSRAARRVLTRTAVLGALPINRQQQQSVLTPDNRRFLDNQGNKSPEVPRKRMIIGHRSFTIGCDGEDLIELEPIAHSTPAVAPLPPKPKPLVHKDSVLSTATSLSLTSIDSDSDTDDHSSSYGQHRQPCLISSKPQILTSTTKTHASTSEHQATLRTRTLHIGVNNKRLSSTSLSSWESEAVTPSDAPSFLRSCPVECIEPAGNNNDTIPKINAKQHSRLNSSSDSLFGTPWSMKYESIHEDMEVKCIPSSSPHSTDSESELSNSTDSRAKGQKKKDTNGKNMNIGDTVNSVVSDKKSKSMQVQSSTSGQFESCSEEINSGQDPGSSTKEEPKSEEMLVTDRKIVPQDNLSSLQLRRGSLKRQKHVEDDEVAVMPLAETTMPKVCEQHSEVGHEIIADSEEQEKNYVAHFKKGMKIESSQAFCQSPSEHLSSVQPPVNLMDQRGDSFEMEEICICGDDEAAATKLIRARSDSSGFLDGDSETLPARLAANGTTKLRANEDSSQHVMGESNDTRLESSDHIFFRLEDTSLPIASKDCASDSKHLYVDTSIHSPSCSNYETETNPSVKAPLPNNLFQELTNTGSWAVDNHISFSKHNIIPDRVCSWSGSSPEEQSAIFFQQKPALSKYINATKAFPICDNNLENKDNISVIVTKEGSHNVQCHEGMDNNILKHNFKIKDTNRLRTASLHCTEKCHLSMSGIKRAFSAPYSLQQIHTCDRTVRHGSQSSLHNMFSSCSDVSVIQCIVCGKRRPSDVGDSIIHLYSQVDKQHKNDTEKRTHGSTNFADVSPAVKKSVQDLSKLMGELTDRGWEISMGSESPHFACHTDQQHLLRLHGDAVRAGLAAYGHQLMESKVHQDNISDIAEAQKDLQNVNEVRNCIASELRHIANLLEEQPPHKAASITSQMAVLLHEQARLCKKLEADDTEIPPAVCVQPTSCCLLLDTVRKENQYLQSLVEKNTRELSEIRQMLKELLAEKAGTKLNY